MVTTLKNVTHLTPYCLATGVRSRYHRITNQTKGNAMMTLVSNAQTLHELFQEIVELLSADPMNLCACG
jgi:hypothetical protein